MKTAQLLLLTILAFAVSQLTANAQGNIRLPVTPGASTPVESPKKSAATVDNQPNRVDSDQSRDYIDYDYGYYDSFVGPVMIDAVKIFTGKPKVVQDEMNTWLKVNKGKISITTIHSPIAVGNELVITVAYIDIPKEGEELPSKPARSKPIGDEKP